MNKLKRYIIFIIGLFINSLGVSLITKASLGTSPISSIPYVLSLNYPLTLGNFTIIFSILLIVLQIIILRKNFKIENILQIPVSIAFGYFIDLTMYLFFWVNPQNYLLKILALLIGCIILGFGVYMEVVADVVMLPGESFVRAVAQTWNTNFGTTKIIFDSSMAIIAAILSFVFSGKLNGVREGTVIAALLVGFIARLFGKRLEFIKPYLFPEDYRQQGTGKENTGLQNENKPDIHNGQKDDIKHGHKDIIHNKNVIVIGRQYGCGGNEFGKILADRLGYTFYDKDIIKTTAKTTGMTPEFIRSREENMTNSLLYDLINQMYQYGKSDEEAPKDKIFEAESNVITQLASKGNCVIMGRCSDYVMRNDKNTLKIFLSAPIESRIKRVSHRLNITEKESAARIRKEDKRRADNYRYYTNRMWGNASNYDISLNTDLGYEDIVKMIMKIL